MVLPTVAANGGRRLNSPRRINIRNRSNNKNSNKLNISGLSLLIFVVILLWASIVFVSPRLIHHQTNSNSYLNDKLQGPPLQSQHHNTKKKKKKKKKRGLLSKLVHHAPVKGRGRLGSINHSSIPPRVVGMYAYPLNNQPQVFTEDNNKKNRNDMRNFLPNYKYITERISPYLLSQTSETLRRIRHHDYFAKNTPLQDFVYNYKMAISGNSDSYQIKSEDPLKHLMIDSDSRDMLRSIEEDSEDYEGSMAEPLNNEKCEATPQQEAWMVHAKSTCNYIHENDMYTDMRHQKTKLLGNGYWRDVWPVYDSEPLTFKAEKKVALKTIRW